MRPSRASPTCVDRYDLWRSRISDAIARRRRALPRLWLHFVTRCIASGTHSTLGRIRPLIHLSNSPSRSRGACLHPGFATLLHSPRTEGGRSAEKRSGACEAPVGRALGASQDARERAYDAARQAPSEAPCVPGRGTLASRRSTVAVFHPGPRFRLLGRPPSYNGGHLPSGSVQRAPRSQVVVPGGRGPGPPEANGYKPPAAGRHASLRLQDVSGDAPR